jgi:hypothetical protein
MYPVSFKRRLWLHLALASLLVGTPVFLPQLAFLGNWAGYVLSPPYFGGFRLSCLARRIVAALEPGEAGP